MTDAPRAAAPDVSIVVPIYNEVDNLPDLVARIGAAMARQPLRFELLAVDDGSTDGSAARLRELAAATPWLRPVFLARNYGQSSALQAGFDRVRGRYVVTLDADLQNEPDDIPLLLERLEVDPDVDMVSGWRKDRQDAELSRKLPSRIANRLISRATGVYLHDYGCALKAYRRPIIDRLRLYGELHRFIPSLAKEAGARITEVPVRHHARTRGVSKYGIDRTFRVILDLILVVFFMRYRQRPLHAFGGLGLWLAAPGVLMLGWLFVLKLFGEDIGGRPLLLVGVMLVLMGVQLIAAGLIGELLTRIYHEAGGVPQFHAEEYVPGDEKNGGLARADTAPPATSLIA
ncbi:glycosyltransferase family 2 protein [Ottowia sp.]|jgi:glycosyltransferase involved in cell wall biosynthesis|uniref:glycosyltransferase family 2 protein n=1 Tax=Ottowia sp. TaxID=1898956 RepID=UPI0025EA84C4|nr:glycosyltransferase family 2 protein [Ottowia sp.]MBK6614851.1 glycosyltransferase family 2 protein [Ottowia sp.]MBK6745934.1 glycosyltransferase family 2 protein [Ottowia sp.]